MDWTIYLAETSYDLKDNRDNIKRELESNGFIVLPNKVIENFEEVYKNEVAAFWKIALCLYILLGARMDQFPTDQQIRDRSLKFKMILLHQNAKQMDLGD